MVKAATSTAAIPAQYWVLKHIFLPCYHQFSVLHYVWNYVFVVLFFWTGTKCVSLVAVGCHYISGVQLASLACLGLGEPWQAIFQSGGVPVAPQAELLPRGGCVVAAVQSDQFSPNHVSRNDGLLFALQRSRTCSSLLFSTLGESHWPRSDRMQFRTSSWWIWSRTSPMYFACFRSCAAMMSLRV